MVCSIVKVKILDKELPPRKQGAPFKGELNSIEPKMVELCPVNTEGYLYLDLENATL